MKKLENVNNIDNYIAACPADIQATLTELRNTIRKAAPEAKEKISYQMPAFEQKGILVYFAAQKEHIGFYPTSSGVEAFKKELSGYSTSKGVVRFPYEKPLPQKLISEIVRFRVIENLEKDELKRKKKIRSNQ
jgi:uncharacterized protein YdhG (YjbR/CyaY superfamily)